MSTPTPRGARVRARLVALGLALAATATAHVAHGQARTPAPPAPSARAERRPLVELRFEPALEREDPWALTGVRRGELVDDALAREVLRRALALGTFAEARAELAERAEGIALTIRGARRMRATEVRIAGARERGVDAVRADLAIPEGTWLTDAEREAARMRLEVAYREAGYASVRVRIDWAHASDPSAGALVVDVTEGRPTRVERLVLRGIADDLADAVRADVQSVLSAGDLADPRRLDRLESALITSLRRANYLEARVLVREFVPVREARVDVLVSIDPGALFAIRWAGLRWFRPLDLTRALRIEDERGLDAATLTVFANRARDYYVFRGFLDTRVRVELTRRDAENATLLFRVTEGPQVRVRTVSFPGSESTVVNVDALRDVLSEALLEQLPGGELVRALPPESEALLDQGVNSLGTGHEHPYVRLDPERTYVPELYAEAARRMTARYRENGYLDATVDAPTVTRIEGPPPAIDVAFAVHEGPRTVLDEVRFESNDTVPSQQLASAVELRLGSPVTYALLDAARTRLLEAYRDRGHAFARVESSIDRSPDRAHARVRFVIHEGPRVRIGHVLVRGNERTALWSILERMTVVPGDTYNPAAIRTSQRAIGELGYFSNVSVGLAEPELEAAVKDLVVEVSEIAPTVEWRAGFSTGEGVRVGVSYTDRNLRRTGLSLSINGTGGLLLPFPFIDPVFRDNLNSIAPYRWLRGRLSASLQAPAIPRVGRYARAALDLNLGRVIERQFAINSASAGVSTTVRPVAALTLVPALEVQYNNLELLNIASISEVIARAARDRPGDVQRLSRVLLLPQGTTTLFSARVTATLDLRDQVFNPSSGAYFTLTAEYVHPIFAELPMLSDGVTPPAPAQTFRGIASASGYIPIPVPRVGTVVLATNLRGGVNVNVEGDPCKVTYPNRQFFLGGADTMRGWLQDSFIPQDVLPQYAFDQATYPSRCRSSGTSTEGETPYAVPLSQLGGDFYALWRNELRIPIGRTSFTVVGFLDLGNLWKDVNNVRFLVRGAAGIGIRYVSPIGPVGLDFGANLSPLPNDVTVSRFGGTVLGYQVNGYEIPFAASFTIGGI